MFADRTHSRNPREFKDKLYKIRTVLQMVNTSFKFANGSDVTDEPIELHKLAKDYHAAAVQFFGPDFEHYKR